MPVSSDADVSDDVNPRSGRIRTLLAALLRLRNCNAEMVLAVLRSRSLLLQEMKCSACSRLMVQRVKNKRSCKDGFCWQCNNRRCPKHKTTVSVRKGSFFEQFKIPLKTIWCIIAYWLSDSNAFEATNALGINKKIVLRIYKTLRGIVGEHLAAVPIRLGGPGMICQIDETLIFRKRKYNRGRITRQQWVFGIVDPSFKPAKGVLFEVSDRSAGTLLPLIYARCHPGTIIHSDEWAAYNSLQHSEIFGYQTVNHSINFVNPRDGTHTQHVEAYWSRIKRRLKYMQGLLPGNLKGYLEEFMWKDFYRNRKLQVLIGLLCAHQ